jgi:hypothetical protein
MEQIKRAVSGLWVLAAVGVALSVAVSWAGVLEQLSTEYLDGALLQAATAFAVARVLNALISLLQSVEISVMVASVHPGELLDPINDLVEQFSKVMQWAIGSLVIQKVMLGVVSHKLFTVALTGIAAVVLVCSLLVPTSRGTLLLFRAFLCCVFLRLALALSVLLNAAVDHAFLSDPVRDDVALLDALPSQVDVLGLQGVPLEALEDGALSALQAQQNTLQAERDVLLEQIERLKPDMERARQTLAEQERDSSLSQRLGMNRSVEHQAMVERLGALEAEWEAAHEALASKERRLLGVEKERLALAQAKEKSQDGFWSHFSDKVSGWGRSAASLADVETYKGIKAKLEAVIDTLIRLMAFFILKSILLPVLFIYLLIRGFRLIWQSEMKMPSVHRA